MSPSANPTADLPDDGWLIPNILEGSSGADFGCTNDAKVWKAFDKSTTKYQCDRTGMHYSTVGFITTPQHGQLTIPKALRLYTANSCSSCDPLGFTLEGRMDAAASWDQIASGEWPGIAEGLGRNDRDLPINSTYENGDTDFTFTTVHFHGHSAPYLEYKLTFQLRSETTNWFQFAELEMPGMLLPPEPSASPTLSPSISPTKAPSDAPSVS